ncbi:phosphotransferase enzyme family protein [Talaromyces proteolyticus]|uniref:Altered inheritance of mitochondria protein 9, mitochondrial n=1 Tax=Talaromyces proteolyticus TaxID=1131652 RepID=A0AAD4KTQ8_9EURO|nr:phosphotransferase enzyme family protein [Talaromyces proteolyticus]KAH8698635.1 phosphotransferase enzyme family protein [Talaromyces proteolyticus]
MRYVGFNFDALCRRILELCPGADSISNCKKIEGGFNRVFIFTLNDSKLIVARLPFTLAGPSQLATSSEVATIQYLQAKTTIPIPTILDWSNECSNAIGSEYIIMEHAEGVQLHKKWPEMAGNERVRCIDGIYRKLREMVGLKFPAFGSVNFEASLPPDCKKQPLGGGFCVGPHCAPRYWNCNTSEPRYYYNTQPNQGPWTTLNEYCDGLVDAGISRIPPNDCAAEKRALYHGSVQEHLSLLECTRSVLKEMCTHPQIQAVSTPTLFHPDLHKRNIFVSEDDPSKITDIIDWQSVSIEPAFWYADEVPDFAIPDDSENNVCAKAFDTCSRFLTPKLSGPRLMDEDLFRPFLYGYRTWKDGVVALRHELIETTRRWNELGFAGSSPYSLPSPNELAKHEREYKLFVAAQDLKHDLSSLLNTATDGWVPLDNWEATELAHEEVFDGMLTAVLTNKNPDHDEPVKDEGVLRSIWPYDLKT